MEIKASACLNADAYRALSRISFSKKRDPAKEMRVFFIVYGILFTALIAELIAFDSDGNILFMLAALLFTLGLLAFVYYGAPKINYKNAGKFRDADVRYMIRDDEIHVEMRAEEYADQATVKYSALCKAYETSAYFFLYIKKNSAFIIDKTTFEGGSPEDLRAVLEKTLGKQFVPCKY